MKRRSLNHLNNGLAAALDVIGEWWTPLIMRAVFTGNVRFEAIQADLGVARNILTDRLTSLVEAGVLQRVQYNDRPVRYEYRLTDKGEDLYGALVTLKAWGEKWFMDGVPTPEVLHTPCRAVLSPKVICSDCGTELRFDDTHIPHSLV